MDFNIASSGLSNAQRNIEVISNNIANENTEGYRKQTVSNSEAPSISKGGLYQGTGVRTEDISQKVDDIIYQNVLNKVGTKTYFDSAVVYSQVIENIFQDNESLGINQDIKDVFTSLNDLKNNTENKAIETIVLDDFTKLSNNFISMISSLETNKDIIANDVSRDIEVLNTKLRDLQEAAKSLKIQFSPDVADRKAILEQEISSMIDTEIYYDSNGEYNVLIAGHKVLDSFNFRELEFTDNKILIKDRNINITDNLHQGSIAAKTHIGLSRNNMIDTQILKLDVLAAGLISEFNTVFQGNAFETATSKSFSPDNLANLNILDNPELKGINPGNMTFIIHNYQDNVTEEFTVNISHNTSLADLQTQIDTESGGKVFLSFSTGKISITAGGLPIQIIEDENLNFSKVLGINNLFEGNSASTIKLNSQFKYNSDSLFVTNDKLVTNANYETIDKLTDLQFKEVNYQEILRYQDYFNKEYYLNSTTNTIGVQNDTFSSFFENITFSVSKKVSNNIQSQTLQNSIFEAANKQYEENVNVNKDEELVKLLEYQAAYAANAKVISAMNEMFDTILRMT